jgi:hypothetical protein
MSTRDAVIEMIRRMPENSSVPDIIAELYFRQKVDEGLQQLDANEGVAHDEATKRLDKWLA